MAFQAASHPSWISLNRGKRMHPKDDTITTEAISLKNFQAKESTRASLGITIDRMESLRLHKSRLRSCSYVAEEGGLDREHENAVIRCRRASTRVRVSAGPEPATAASETPPRRKMPGENKGFVEEMRFVAMKLHTKDQAKEGQQDTNLNPVAKWEPTVEGYLKFLVDSKLVFDTLEGVVEKAAHPSYAIFKNTGLERSAALAKDLEWFEKQGHQIPSPGPEGTSYADLLRILSETDPPAFICHFYNVYFAHSAGGRFIGKKVAEMLLDGRELNFYKWDADLPELLASVKLKLNMIAENWTREEKNHCLQETKKSFKFSGDILRLIVT